MFLKSSTIFLLYLELKPENSIKLKTGFDFRRSVSVRFGSFDYSFKYHNLKVMTGNFELYASL